MQLSNDQGVNDMMTTNEFLDAVKQRHGFKSDYELSKALGVKQQTISSYRVGRTSMDPMMAAKVAELLAMNPLEVIAAAEAERAKDEKTKGFWMRYAAALLVAVGVSSPPAPAEASQAQASEGICIMSNRRRQILEAVGTVKWAVCQLLAGPQLRLL